MIGHDMQSKATLFLARFSGKILKTCYAQNFGFPVFWANKNSKLCMTIIAANSSNP